MEATAGSYVSVAGRMVNRAAFIASLRAKNPEATRALVRQIKDDIAHGAEGSRGLELFSEAFRGNILSWLQSRRFPDDPTAAAEVWSETLFRVWRKAGEYDETRSTFLTWAMNQAKWAASEYARRVSRRREVSLTHQFEAMPEESEPERLTEAQRRAHLHAFTRLTETQQLLVRARYVSGLRHSEIANDVLAGSQSEANVRVYVNRAMAVLRRHYQDEFERSTREGGASE
jgi:RNA polymerase sigma factor (sigma-70 family)